MNVETNVNAPALAVSVADQVRAALAPVGAPLIPPTAADAGKPNVATEVAAILAAPVGQSKDNEKAVGMLVTAAFEESKATANSAKVALDAASVCERGFAEWQATVATAKANFQNHGIRSWKNDAPSMAAYCSTISKGWEEGQSRGRICKDAIAWLDARKDDIVLPDPVAGQIRRFTLAGFLDPREVRYQSMQRYQEECKLHKTLTAIVDAHKAAALKAQPGTSKTERGEVGANGQGMASGTPAGATQLLPELVTAARSRLMAALHGASGELKDAPVEVVQAVAAALDACEREVTRIVSAYAVDMRALAARHAPPVVAEEPETDPAAEPAPGSPEAAILEEAVAETEADQTPAEAVPPVPVTYKNKKSRR
jgi:hypothetical protein